MGRPKKQNPKNKHIGIVTTEEKFRRFKALNLKGDEAIDILLHYLESEKMELDIKRSQAARNIKKLKKQIEDLEYEVLKEQSKLDAINEQISSEHAYGLDEITKQCIDTALQRFDSRIWSIEEFLDTDKYQELFMVQANRCHKELDEFKELVKNVV